MRVFTVICLVIVATLASGDSVPGDGVIGSKNLLSLKLNNPGDVYLVGNFLACLNAYSNMSRALSLELDSPLSFVAQNVFIYEYADTLVFFNQITGKLLLMVPKEKLQEILLLVNVSSDLYRLPLEVAFNAYLGINHVKLTKNCAELFNYVGNILSELVGVGCKPTAVLNLLGLLNFSTIFPPDLVVVQPHSPLNGFRVQSPVELALIVAQVSIIVDAAAHSNKNFLFQDIMFPARTVSRCKIGNAIGNKDILYAVPELLKYVLNLMSFDDMCEFMVQVLLTVTIDAQPDKLYENFFALVAQSYAANMVPAVPSVPPVDPNTPGLP